MLLRCPLGCRSAGAGGESGCAGGGGTWLAQARRCAVLTAKPSDPVEDRATVQALRLTAERAGRARPEAKQLGRGAARSWWAVMAPALLAQPGVGPITAAQVLISWSHPGRLRSEAAFAMLAVVAPIPASSGRVVRHRLTWWGPAAEPGPAHHCHDPRGLARANQARCGPPHRRGQGPTRDPPLPDPCPGPPAVLAAGAPAGRSRVVGPLQVLDPQRELARVRPNKWGQELLLQVVCLLQLQELPGEVVQPADLTVTPGCPSLTVGWRHRPPPAVGKQPGHLLKQRRVPISAQQPEVPTTASGVRWPSDSTHASNPPLLTSPASTHSKGGQPVPQASGAGTPHRRPGPPAGTPPHAGPGTHLPHPPP